MRRVQYVPGAIGAGGAHTLPAGSPQIDQVSDAQIWHLPVAIGMPGDHVGADVVPCIDDHPVHAHDLAVGGAVMVTPSGASAGGNDIVDGAGAAIPGGGATGVQDNALPQDHVATVVDLAHGGMAPADPILNATPTKVNATQFTLNQNTILGDLLTIVYLEVGERVRAS
jgi:hypothetical protein